MQNISRLKVPCRDLPSQQETAEYISEMLLEMKGLAAKTDLTVLAVLLALAHHEADFRAKDGR